MLGHANDAHKTRLIGDRHYKGRAIAALAARPAIQPVCDELLGGYERDLWQPAAVKLIILDIPSIVVMSPASGEGSRTATTPSVKVPAGAVRIVMSHPDSGCLPGP
jgi:hypothetical protein